MPALITLRRKIRSVRSTRRITNAMKIIAATRVRRAQEALWQLRPYAWRMQDVLRSLASRVRPELHPLLRWPEAEHRVDLLVVTADRGLCGAFNHNIVREALRFLHGFPPDTELRLWCIGRKGHDFFRKRRWPIAYAYRDIFRRVDYTVAQTIARQLIEEFVTERIQATYVVYNEYKSALVQRVVVERLLPLQRIEFSPVEPPVEYIYEPEPERIFEALLPKHVVIQVYRILLESQAAEQSARMVAMDMATKNADKVIYKLTLLLNKTRQASITKEILEIISGAEALRKARA